MMVNSRPSIRAMRSCFSRSFFSIWSWFVLNSSTLKSLCLISSAFCLRSYATMSSMAFFDFAKASRSHLAFHLDESRVEGPCRHVMIIIKAQDSERLGADFHLQLAGLLALFPLDTAVRDVTVHQRTPASWTCQHMHTMAHLFI